MLPTIDLSNVHGGGGSGWATGGFWTGRTRDDEERAERDGSGLATGGFWTGRTRREVEDNERYRGESRYEREVRYERERTGG
jgi:hypothetical protein